MTMSASPGSCVVFDFYRRGPHNALPSEFEPFNAKAFTHKHPETGLPGQDTDPCQLSHAWPHSRVQHSFLTRLHDGDHALWSLTVGPTCRNQDGCFCAACSKVEHTDGRIVHFDRVSGIVWLYCVVVSRAEYLHSHSGSSI